jgi:hypothetical protein
MPSKLVLKFYRLASSFNQSTDHHITLSGLNESAQKTVALFEDLLTNARKMMRL